MEKLQQNIIDYIEKQYKLKFKSKLAFAEAVGCDEKTIRSLFTNRHKMTMDLFLKITKALGVSPSEFLKDVGL